MTLQWGQTDTMIYGDRVRQVRELQGWTQTKLAERVGVTQPYVAQVESGKNSPSAEFVAKLAFQTGFSAGFFAQVPDYDFPAGSLLFRAHSTLGSVEKAGMYRYAQVAYDIFRSMQTKGKIKDLPVHLPTGISNDPKRAASVTRSELGLAPDLPIANLTNALEKAGVVALASPKPFQDEDFDAFSLWAGVGHQQPIIVMSGGKPGDRLRFSVAHELGHLVMHRPLLNELDKIEKQAHFFAGEFLLPEGSMRAEITSPVTLDTFVALKPRWGVSIQALIVRARDLGIITQRKYKYLFQQLSSRGWRACEPSVVSVPMEKPRGLRQLAELVYGVPIDYERFSNDVQIQEPFLRLVVEAHAAGRCHIGTEASSTRKLVTGFPPRSSRFQ